MTRKNDGGPAFAHGNPQDGGDPGMSLRDYFAGQALAGFAAIIGESIKPHWHLAAKDAYDAADAMLAAREKGGDT